MRELDCTYFERRRQECLARAEAATDPQVGRIHRQFAAAYADRLKLSLAEDRHRS